MNSQNNSLVQKIIGKLKLRIHSVSQKYKNYREIRGLKNTINNGIKVVNATGKTPVEAYNAMRELYIRTKGESNVELYNRLRTDGYAHLPWNKGVLGFSSAAEFKTAVQSMKENGYYIFDAKLSEEDIENLRKFATTAPCVHGVYDETSGKTIQVRREDGVSTMNEQDVKWPRYDIPMDEIVKSEKVQELMTDTSIIAFAQEYLETKPILDLIAFWWSYPFSGKMKSEAAQMYHFDLDRIKFMKFFFYLTDVDTSTGPHCYVKGSHRKLHENIKKDGRYTDELIAKSYGAENMLEITGKAGTIIAVDTIGMHKGKDLMHGNRLLLQLEFTCHMFGHNYPVIAKPALKGKQEESYRTYQYSFSKLFSEVDH